MMDAAISAGFWSESEVTSFQQNILKRDISKQKYHYNLCV
jgi:hypothetical protein